MAFLAALAPYAVPAISSFLASQAPTIASLGSKILAHGVKQSVPELLSKVKNLAGSQAGRDKLLNVAGKLTGQGTNVAGEALGLLNKYKILGDAATARHQGTINKVKGGLQFALGKLSKINRRFG